MDIDDEFADYMRSVHAGVAEDSAQYSITRNAFFAGMMGIIGVLTSGKPKQQVHLLLDIQRQLMSYAARAKGGMEQGFTDTNFRE